MPASRCSQTQDRCGGSNPAKTGSFENHYLRLGAATRDTIMKVTMTVAIAVLVAAISSPVLARSAGSWPQDRAPHYRHSSNPAFDVYENGQYIGSDPDPNIRAQLRFGHGRPGEW
jgi:hypothetical protein